MADTVTSQTIFKGNRKAIYTFTNVSDSTGENNVKKIDITTLSLNPTGQAQVAPTKLNITRVIFNTSGMGVKIAYNHTTPQTVLALNGSFDFDFSSFGGITDPGGSGGDGSINFSTIAATNNAVYTVTIEVTLHG